MKVPTFQIGGCTINLDNVAFFHEWTDGNGNGGLNVHFVAPVTDPPDQGGAALVLKLGHDRAGDLVDYLKGRRAEPESR